MAKNIIYIYSMKYTYPLIITLFFSCSNQSNYNQYAIRDFSSSLQPYLTSIVSSDIAQWDTSTSYLETHTSDKELEQLSHSEHPVLRAVALRAILRRKSMDHFDILMNHLDDTGHLHFDFGEWGIGFTTVSDDLIENFEWENMEQRQKTIDAVITKHNYLNSAYTILPKIKATPEYYSYIKQMVQHQSTYYVYRQKALYALASYKKQEDIPIIKQILLDNRGSIGYNFNIIEKFPDTAYMEVLERCYKSVYTRMNWDKNLEYSNSFSQAVAVYKNERSAIILSKMLNRKPNAFGLADTSYFKNRLIDAIWNNKCAAYDKLIAQIKPYIEETEHENQGLPLEPEEIVGPITIRW
ncbi:MAG: hypothetical protein ABI921_04090 [Panacibacter sp.]